MIIELAGLLAAAVAMAGIARGRRGTSAEAAAGLIAVAAATAVNHAIGAVEWLSPEDGDWMDQISDFTRIAAPVAWLFFLYAFFQGLVRRDLRESDARYQMIVEAAAEGVWRADERGWTVFVNDRLARMLGRSAAEMTGRPIWDFVAPEWREEGQKHFAANLEGQAREFEIGLLARSGEVVWSRLRTQPVFTDGGRCAGGLAMVTDVGERRSTEERLRYAEQRLRAHADNSPLAYVEWDGQFRVLSWSSQAERMFGWKADEVLGRHFHEWRFVHEDDEHRVAETVRRLQVGDEPRNISSNRNYNKWGQTLHCEWYNSCLYDGQRNPTSFLSFVQDVTDRRRAEQAQRESEALHRMLAEHSGDMFTLHAPDGRYLYVSPVSRRLLGRSPEEMLGMNPYELFHPDEEAMIRLEHVRLLRERDHGELRYRIRHADGRYVWLESNTRAITDPDTGEVTQLITVSRDVTARHEAERQQAWMMRELDHRVRNNLTAIISLMEQTADASGGFEDFRASFAGRLRALERTHTLLAQTKWEGMSLAQLAHQTLAAYSDPDAMSEVVEIEGPDLTLPAGAAPPLCMALHELATNAAKYGALSKSGGRVSLRWSVERSDGEEALRMEWRERGGPAVREPSRRGYGMDLIEGAIGYELGGRLDLRFEPEGLVCEIDVDLEPLRERERQARREA